MGDAQKKKLQELITLAERSAEESISTLGVARFIEFASELRKLKDGEGREALDEKHTCTAAERRLLDLTMGGIASPGQMKDAKQAVVDERLTPQLRHILLGFYIDIARAGAARDKFESVHGVVVTQELHLQLLDEASAAVAAGP